jgi:hypothetical protein
MAGIAAEPTQMADKMFKRTKKAAAMRPTSGTTIARAMTALRTRRRPAAAKATRGAHPVRATVWAMIAGATTPEAGMIDATMERRVALTDTAPAEADDRDAC